MTTMPRRKYPSLADAPITYPCLGDGQHQRAELADVRVLSLLVRTAGHPTTWAWDTHSELVALWCFTCAEVADGYGDRTWDNDTCQHCGSEDTARVITNIAGHIVRGPNSLI